MRDVGVIIVKVLWWMLRAPLRDVCEVAEEPHRLVQQDSRRGMAVVARELGGDVTAVVVEEVQRLLREAWRLFSKVSGVLDKLLRQHVLGNLARRLWLLGQPVDMAAVDLFKSSSRMRWAPRDCVWLASRFTQQKDSMAAA
eukprot:CAMPEP_0176097362 /NCGR_PEP_ID=MMETSP0120_2-20121206/48812_1 /TAXON_ID=160619 /ORGANISM="Kryptoperidinium foliaceum, Strain CCMP 1326" /LENGTH=140 /DNA_ID=CAMNT_0017431357 /DNA_START=265 /DNA_END=685 /DNA_ORIENTATION=+